MAISSIAEYQAASKQIVLYSKSTTSWGGNVFYSNLRVPGGTVGDFGAPANNTSGTVPASPATGLPTIYNLGGGGTFYITGVEAALTGGSPFIAFNYILADVLWYGGPYSTATALVTLSSQPSFLNRLPDGSYTGLEIWTIGSGGSSGSRLIEITYTNENGATGHTTGQFDFNTTISNVGLQAIRAPLQAGDLGVQKIESVIGPGIAGYSCNVAIIRPLFRDFIIWGNTRRRWIDTTNMPVVYQTSALTTMVQCHGSPNGSVLLTCPIELAIEISAGQPYTGVSGVTWNPSDKTANLTLSNGNLTAADGGAGAIEVRATFPRSNGRFYWEIVGDTLSTSSTPYIGIHPMSTALGSGSGPFSAGGDYGLFMRSPNDGYQTYQPGSNVTTVGPAHVNGDVFMFAADLTALKFWIGRNGSWSSGNPDTNTGGMTITANTWAPWCNVDISQVTARFESASWTYTCPSGFEPWH